MRFQVVGYGDLPEEGYRDEWWTEILTPNSIIPPEGQPAVDVLKNAGIPIKAMYICHEAPKLLTKPKEDANPKDDHHDDANTLEDIVGILATILLAIGTIIGFLFLAAIRIDPILYVVLEDGTHLEVAKWYDYISP